MYVVFVHTVAGVSAAGLCLLQLMLYGKLKKLKNPECWWKTVLRCLCVRTE